MFASDRVDGFAYLAPLKGRQGSFMIAWRPKKAHQRNQPAPHIAVLSSPETGDG